MVLNKCAVVFCRTLLTLLVGSLSLGSFAPPNASAQTVNGLIAQAKREGALDAMVINGLTGRTTGPLAAAFKKRFGLDIDVTLTPLSNTAEYPKAIARLKAGALPVYDVLEGQETNNLALMGLGGVQKIDNWERLMTEINPQVRGGKIRPEYLSPGPFKGFGFAYMSREKALLYNPRLISKDRLPKTHAELADAKYKGMWAQPPWTTHWEPGPFVLAGMTKEKWLDVVRTAGRHAGAVLEENAAVQRVLLGEYAFTMGNTYYYFQTRAQDPKAPLDITYFEDYNSSNKAYYILQKNAKHSAAGTLFMLWMATPEAEAIWQSERLYNQLWGESKLDKRIKAFIEESRAKVIDYFDTDGGVEFLKWMETEDGRKYKEALGRAIRGE